MRKFSFKTAITITLALFLVVGFAYAAESIINNFYGNTTVNQPVGAGEEPVLGTVSDIAGGICDGDEPVTQLCNTAVYDLYSQTDFNLAGLVTKISTGEFLDASTTLLSVVNPFGTDATSTVDLIKINNTGAATTSYGFYCGAAKGNYVTPTYNIASTTENIAADILFGTIENNITAALNGNSQGYGGGAVAKIMVTPAYPYIVCKVKFGAEGAFTEVTNTFEADYLIRWNKY